MHARCQVALKVICASLTVMCWHVDCMIICDAQEKVAQTHHREQDTKQQHCYISHLLAVIS